MATPTLPLAAQPATRATVLAAPVVSESSVWKLGQVPTAPAWETAKSGFIQAGHTDIDRRLPTGARELGMTLLGRKTSLPGKPLVSITKIAREQDGQIEFISRESLSKRKVRQFFHERGFAVPKKASNQDLTVLGSLKLPEPQKTKSRDLIDVKKTWMRTPEWKLLQEQLSFATQNAQAGRPLFARTNLKAAQKIAERLTGLSLRPEVVAEIEKEADYRKAALKVAGEHEYRQEVKDALRSFEKISAELDLPRIGDALTDYLDLETITPFPPRGDTLEERGAYDRIPGMQLGLANTGSPHIKGAQLGFMSDGMTAATLADAAAERLFRSGAYAMGMDIPLIDERTFPALSALARGTVPFLGGRNTRAEANTWRLNQASRSGMLMDDGPSHLDRLRVLGLTPTFVSMRQRPRIDPITFRVEKISATMSGGGNSGGQGQTSVSTDPLTGATIAITEQNLGSTVTVESASVMAGGRSASVTTTTVVQNVARQIYAILVQNNRPMALDPNDPTAAQPLSNLNGNAVTWAQIMAMAITLVTLALEKADQSISNLLGGNGDLIGVDRRAANERAADKLAELLAKSMSGKNGR